MARRPPAKAKATVMATLPNRRIASAPPKAAPDDTPMICGPTSGLRNTPWSEAPAIASPAPARQAASTRGSRTSSTTRCSGSDQLTSSGARWLTRIATTCEKGIP